MSVIAIVNRKGGSGKSTLSTHVASYLASLGQEVMLGDVDRLQSSRLWLSLRKPQYAHIHGWSIDESKFARPPAGVRHVVLDTPGGFQGFSLMKVSMHADTILIPATDGIFDKTAAEESIRELRTFPRIMTGKCSLACVGMRVDGRTKQAQEIAAWAERLNLPLLGTIRMAQVYARCLEQGVAIFDFPSTKVERYLEDWQGLTHWVNALLSAAPAVPGSHLTSKHPPLASASKIRPTSSTILSSSPTRTPL